MNRDRPQEEVHPGDASVGIYGKGKPDQLVAFLDFLARFCHCVDRGMPVVMFTDINAFLVPVNNGSVRASGICAFLNVDLINFPVNFKLVSLFASGFSNHDFLLILELDFNCNRYLLLT